jgi:hypothetical protein
MTRELNLITVFISGNFKIQSLTNEINANYILAIFYNKLTDT